MPAKFLLYFTAGERIVYRRSRGGLEYEASFSAGEEDLPALQDYLNGRRKSLFYVVADLAGEDYHEDQIPFVRGRDRQAILERRLVQRYRDSRIAAVLSLGHVSGERRNERVLLTSFTNAQQFAPVLDALSAAGARLGGLYSVPLVAPALAESLGAREGRCILVTITRAGLRQCFVVDGRLRFARLERTPVSSPADLARHVRSETGRLAQYLTTLRLLPREGPPIQVLVVAPAGQRATFEQALVSDAQLAFHTVDLEQAARKVGLGRAPEGAAAELLFLELAARKPPAVQLARGDERRSFLVWRVQRGIVAAGAAGFVACALYAGSQWLGALEARSQTTLRQNETRAASERYRRITAAFPVTQTSTDNLKATVVQFTKIAERSPPPDESFVQLSGVLERFPRFELDSLSWGLGGAASDTAAAGARPEAPPARSEAQGVSEFLQISGRVTSARRSDFRAVTAQVRKFAAALEAMPGYRLVRTELPFDVSPEGTLTGEIGTTGGDEAPRFTVVVARSLK
jgi:hypothetical protein